MLDNTGLLDEDQDVSLDIICIHLGFISFFKLLIN